MASGEAFEKDYGMKFLCECPQKKLPTVQGRKRMNGPVAPRIGSKEQIRLTVFRFHMKKNSDGWHGLLFGGREDELTQQTARHRPQTAEQPADETRRIKQVGAVASFERLGQPIA